MPPRVDEIVNGNLYLMHQDGTYVKLSDIRNFDIGSSEPPDYKYAKGGKITYEDAPLFKYHPDSPIDYLPVSLEASFTGKMNVSKRKLYMALVGLTERQQRLVIRRMERMRREELKTGIRYKNKLVQACMEIKNKGNSVFFNFLNNY